jgi:hypothetical protein
MDPNDTPLTTLEKKDEKGKGPGISLYRWLGQRQGDEQRKVTFKTDEKPDKDAGQAKENKEEGLEAAISNYLNPQVSETEMSEYERYSLGETCSC